MTIEKVIALISGCKEEDLRNIEKLTDKELEEIFSPVLCVTRPSKEMREEAKKKQDKQKEFTMRDTKKKQALDIAKRLGISLDDVL